VVSAASVQDCDGTKQLLDILRHKHWWLRHIWVDGAYAGPLVNWVRTLRPRWPIRLEIPKRSDAVKGIVVIP
jgi:hypothetical protein